MLLPINPRHPQPRRVERIVEILKNGGVIAYPTDTIYGIGCDIFNKNAIERIYRIKGRDRHKPLSFICRDLSEVSRYAKLDDDAFRVMRRLLPGPYTFVLEATHLVPKIMLTRRHTVGIRVPDHAVSQALVVGLGNPIISTSANLSDNEPISEPSLIHDVIGAQVDAVVDGGPLPHEPSSVIDLTGEEPEVLRVGKGDVSMFPGRTAEPER
jgi:tRNA threonylcarbamoyl adenosine modification protein (Sua5/YciO/YrdC/YwlC family)